MTRPQNSTFWPTLVVIVTGTLWGFYWLPVRGIAQSGLPGAWGTLAIVAAATLVLTPFGLRRRRALAASHPVALASIALGGFAFVLYSVGFLYGRVAIVIILFFLTPVWSTLIGRLLLGWPITRLRLFALLFGLAGLVLMLGADGEVPIPRGLGEWLGLTSGLLWAIATTGIRVKATTGPGETAFVFALGATFGAAIIAPSLEPLPDLSALESPAGLVLAAFATGALWWSLSIAALMWAATRLEPARVGILLMAEVLIASALAALLAGETLSTLEIIGGALVLVAGVLEVLPEREASTR